MPHLNRISQIGRLTRDVESRVTTNGTKIAKFGIANNERKKNSAGEWVDGDPMFLDVTLFGYLADHAAENFRKGMEVFIEGRLQLEQWDDKATGAKRSKHSMIGDTAFAVTWKAKNAERGGQYKSPEPTESSDSYDAPVAPVATSVDIPFGFMLAMAASVVGVLV